MIKQLLMLLCTSSIMFGADPKKIKSTNLVQQSKNQSPGHPPSETKSLDEAQLRLSRKNKQIKSTTTPNKSKQVTHLSERSQSDNTIKRLSSTSVLSPQSRRSLLGQTTDWLLRGVQRRTVGMPFDYFISDETQNVYKNFQQMILSAYQKEKTPSEKLTQNNNFLNLFDACFKRTVGPSGPSLDINLGLFSWEAKNSLYHYIPDGIREKSSDKIKTLYATNAPNLSPVMALACILFIKQQNIPIPKPPGSVFDNKTIMFLNKLEKMKEFDLDSLAENDTIPSQVKLQHIIQKSEKILYPEKSIGEKYADTPKRRISKSSLPDEKDKYLLDTTEFKKHQAVYMSLISHLLHAYRSNTSLDRVFQDQKITDLLWQLWDREKRVWEQALPHLKNKSDHIETINKVHRNAICPHLMILFSGFEIRRAIHKKTAITNMISAHLKSFHIMSLFLQSLSIEQKDRLLSNEKLLVTKIRKKEALQEFIKDLLQLTSDQQRMLQYAPNQKVVLNDAIKTFLKNNTDVCLKQEPQGTSSSSSTASCSTSNENK